MVSFWDHSKLSVPPAQHRLTCITQIVRASPKLKRHPMSRYLYIQFQPPHTSGRKPLCFQWDFFPWPCFWKLQYGEDLRNTGDPIPAQFLLLRACSLQNILYYKHFWDEWTHSLSHRLLCPAAPFQRHMKSCPEHQAMDRSCDVWWRRECRQLEGNPMQNVWTMAAALWLFDAH